MAREQARESSAGFAIGVYDQRHIEDNAREHFGPRYGDPEDRERAMAEGLVDAEGEITPRGWDVLNDDVMRLEANSLNWMGKKFIGARDEGHDRYDDLIGTFWFNPRDPEQAWLIELAADNGRHERIDMVDTSFGDLGDTAFEGVSDFGASVLGGGITFFDVSPEDMEVIEETTLQEMRRARARK